MRLSHREEVSEHYPDGMEDSEVISLFHVLSSEEVKALRSGKLTIKTVRPLRKSRTGAIESLVHNDVDEEEAVGEAQKDEQPVTAHDSEEDEALFPNAVNDVDDRAILEAMKAEGVNHAKGISSGINGEKSQVHSHASLAPFRKSRHVFRDFSRNSSAGMGDTSSSADMRKRHSYDEDYKSPSPSFGDEHKRTKLTSSDRVSNPDQDIADGDDLFGENSRRLYETQSDEQNGLEDES